MPVWPAIQHVSFESPGLIAAEAKVRGIDMPVVRMDLGEELPSARDIDGLVVMGGPMGVNDKLEHDHLVGEVELIRLSLEREIPVLAVCLGAQLMAAAAGADVFQGPVEEAGPGEVRLVAEDPVLGPAGTDLPVIHWHQDTFDIPAGARLLASSDVYPHQAFAIGRAAYGLQFHVEIGLEAALVLRPHFPFEVSEGELTRIETSGRRVISRFFDLATGPEI